MRVLVVPYPWEGEVVGGHVTQQNETVRALQRHGVDAAIATIDEAVESDADVVHAFEDVRPLLARGRPRGRLIVTPIYFPRSFVLSAMPMYRSADPLHRLEVRVRHQAHILRHRRARIARLVDLAGRDAAWGNADLVVVNSKAEGELLRRDVPALGKVQVAYSGVAEEAFHGDPREGRRLLGIGDQPFVLSVARIEPIKNLVSLALAVRELDVGLVLVGSVLPGNEGYAEQVRAAMPDLIHVPHIEHAQLPHVHAAAAVHALPSWYETTGLSTLEALAVGAPVVVARGPCVNEYFGEVGHLCDAADISSIRAALERALDGPRGIEQEHARAFSWDRTAERLSDLYLSVAARGRPARSAESDRRPNTVVVGAQRAGTTMLLAALAEHPQVEAARGEYHGFADPTYGPGSAAEISGAFGVTDAARRVFKCASYFGQPAVADRLAADLDVPDIVVILRDPVRRAVSAWYWYVYVGLLPLEGHESALRRLLRGEDHGHEWRHGKEILEWGRYAQLLERWTATFPREKVHVLTDIDLRHDAGRTIQDLYAKLGLDPGHEPLAVRQRFNDGIYSLHRLRWLRLRNRWTWREDSAGRWYTTRPEGIGASVAYGTIHLVDRAVFAHLGRSSTPKLSADLELALWRYYEDDVRRLEGLIDRDLSGWRRSDS